MFEVIAPWLSSQCEAPWGSMNEKRKTTLIQTRELGSSIRQSSACCAEPPCPVPPVVRMRLHPLAAMSQMRRDTRVQGAQVEFGSNI